MERNDFLCEELSDNDKFIIKSKVKKNIYDIFLELSDNSELPIKVNSYKNSEMKKKLEKIEKKITKMNNYLVKYGLEMIISKKDTKEDKLKYIVLPIDEIVIEKENSKEQRHLYIIRFYIIESNKIIDVLIEKEKTKNKVWIDNYLRVHKLVVEKEYKLLMSAVQDYIKNEINENIGMYNDIFKIVTSKKFQNYKKEKVSIPGNWIKQKRINKEYLREIYNKIDININQNACLISFLMVSFLNNILTELKIESHFILLMQGNKYADGINLIKYFLGNPFNNAEFDFDNIYETNIIIKEIDKEVINFDTNKFNSNVLVLDLFDENKAEKIEIIQKDLFSKYVDRNKYNKKNSFDIKSNIAVFSSAKINNPIYFSISLNESEISSEKYVNKIDYINLLLIIAEYLSEESLSIKRSLYDRFISYRKTIDNKEEKEKVSLDAISKVSILMLGFDIYLEFGEYIKAIERESKKEKLALFQKWLLCNYNDTINLNGINKPDFIESMVRDILNFIIKDYNEGKSLLIERMLEPPDENYIGFYDDEFKIVNYAIDDNINNNTTDRLIFLEKNFINKIDFVKDSDIKFDDIADYLIENHIAIMRRTEKNRKTPRVTLHTKKNNVDVLVLRISKIEKFLKEHVEI
ncbi:hypothetical protein [Desnuesiella massiliensis]|uniref:hypothetical protein n=1 Tax=Desnuesiella massiliensis TaxID=1650662 RepID=UPI0006E1277A|nr:hypothetical protein [Desnuesiella massiliensis]